MTLKKMPLVYEIWLMLIERTNQPSHNEVADSNRSLFPKNP